MAVIFHAIAERVCGAEQRHMRRQRQRDLGGGLREKSAALRDRVNVRCTPSLWRVAAQNVCAQRIHGDKDDWGRSWSALRCDTKTQKDAGENSAHTTSPYRNCDRFGYQ